LWTEAANILNKESQRIKGGPSVWGLGEVITRHRKKPACYEMLHMASELDRSFGMT